MAARWTRSEQVLTWLLLGVAVAVAVWKRAPALDPDSLWVDDLWVALACSRLDLAALRELHLPTPLGFLGASKLVAQWSGDPELGFQLVPFTAGLVQIPLFAWLVRRVTGDRSIAVVGALLAASNPVAAEYAVRVKQFVPEQLVSTVLLLAALPVLREPDHTAARWRLVAAVGIGVLFSFGAVLLAVCLLHTLPLAWLRRPGLLRRCAPILVGDALLAVYWLVELRRNRSAGLRAFWSDHYLGGVDGASLLRFAEHVMLHFPVKVFALPLLVAWLLFPAAIWWMLRRGDRGMVRLALASLGLLAMMVAAAALGMVPIGVGRTESFSHPVCWLVVCVGLRAFATLPVRWLVVVGCLVVHLAAARVRYPDERDRAAVVQTQRLLRDGDALWLAGHAALAVSYYGPWPVRLTPDEAAGHHFAPVLGRARTSVLPLRGGTARVAELLRPLPQPPRIVLLSTHGDLAADAALEGAVEQHGYRVVERADHGPHARIRVFTRR